MESISDHFLKKAPCFMLDHLPAGIDRGNYKRILGDFVFVGVTERMDKSVKGLARALGKDLPKSVPHSNKSRFSKTPSLEVAEKWISDHELEFSIWEWAKDRLGTY